MKKLKNTGVLGAVSELIVCVDLSKRGYDVFRAIAPSCPCDLIAMKDNELLRVEVKTGRYNHKGILNYCMSEDAKSKFDILTLATHKEVFYFPKL